MSLVNIFTLDLDLKNINYVSEPNVTSSDTARFVVNVTDDGLPYDLTTSTSFTLATTRPDGLVILKSGTRTGANQITFDFGVPSTSVPGRSNAKVQMYDADGRVSAVGFTFMVSRDPSGSNYEPTSYDKTLIQEVLGEGPAILEAAETAIANANDAASYAISTADDASDYARSTAETTAAGMTNTANTAIANVTAQMDVINDNYNDNMAIYHKGTVATYAALPTTGLTVGDAYVVTADPDPNKNGTWRRQNNNTWLRIYTYVADGKETISNVSAVDVARAELMRTQYHSGVIGNLKSYTGSFNSIPADADGAIQTIGANFSSYLNMILTNPFKILINGYSNFITKWNVSGGSSSIWNAIQLSTPPTYGTRDDLVFLEAWFPVGGTPGQMSWRIRTVAGVDFNKFTDGLKAGTQDLTYPCLAQGGNASPVMPTGNSSVDFTYTFYDYIARTNTGSSARKVNTEDVGLYMAGDGTSTSKTTLATADGYVYAIPLFRVKRRNSGGYRKDNLSGARDFVALKVTSTVNVTAGNSFSFNLTSGQGVYVKVGDRLLYQGNSTSTWVDVTGVAGDVITGTANYNGTWNNGTDYFCYKSDRPDNLYSNIIDASDIIDLRHQIPTNFTPNILVEGGFDSLMRGALTTKDTKTTTKDVFGLRKAPLGIAQELKSTRIQRTDGTFADLTNLWGIAKDTTTSILAAASGSNIFLGSGIYTASSTVGTKKLSMVSGKNYLVITRWNSPTDASINMLRTYGGSVVADVTQLGGTPVSSNTITYCKFTAPATDVVFLAWRNSAASKNYYHNNTLVVEIDQTTYNLIDVDPNWTGGDNIAKQFPYVDSYPNFVENLYSGGIVSSSGGGSTWNESSLALDVTSGAGPSQYAISKRYSVFPNTNYTLSWVATNISGADNPKVNVRRGSDNGITGITSSIVGTGVKTVTLNTGSEVEIIVFLYGSDATAAVQTKRYENIMLERSDSPSYIYVPFGRYYLDKDYLSNPHLTNNQLPKYSFEGTGGSFNSQRLNFGDPMSVQTVVDVVDPTWNGINKPRHVNVTQATYGVWASGDTIKVRNDYGVVMGAVDADTGVSRIVVANLTATSPVTVTVDDVSKISVSDTFTKFNTDGSVSSNGAPLTVTGIDTTNKTVTLTWAGGFTLNYGVGDLLVETTAATSAPQVAYTAQQGKTAQAGAPTTITLAADASSVTDYYKGLQIIATNSFQLRTITAYNGTTKVATVDTAWTTNPQNGSAYTMYMPGTWTNLGTKEATFTLGTMPTAVDATLGNANTLNATITSSAVYPAGKGISQVATDVLKAEVNDGELLAVNTVGVKANFVGKVTANTDANPHAAWRNGSNHSITSLLAPSASKNTSAAWYTEFVPDVLDGSTPNGTTSTSSGAISQHMFQFDMIRAIEDKYGEIPADGTAAKVALVKAIITTIALDWYGYGSSPTGNKATIAIWNVSNTAWDLGSTNLTGVVAKIPISSTSPSTRIDANGFIHLLAYADAAGPVADPTVAPTLSASGSGSGLSAGTYYVKYAWAVSGVGASLPSAESNITITAGQNIVISGIPSLPFGATHVNIHISTTSGATVGTVQGSTTTSTYTQTGALTTGGSLPKTVNDAIVPSTINTDYVELSITLKTANVSAYDASTDSAGYTVLQPTNAFPVLSENIVPSQVARPTDASALTPYSATSTAAISVIDSNGGVKLTHTGVSSTTKMAITSPSGSPLRTPVKPSTMYTFTIKTKSNQSTRGIQLQTFWYDSAGTIISVSGTQSSIVIAPDITTITHRMISPSNASTVYFELNMANAQPNDEIHWYSASVKEGFSTEWSAGRRKKVTFNLLGKVAGSTVENPHRMKYRNASTFVEPVSEVNYAEASVSQNAINSVGLQDGSLNTRTSSTDGNYAQTVLEFDLSHLGMSLSELKKAFRNFTVTWIGYGIGDNAGVVTNGATLKLWNNTNSTWGGMVSNTASTPTALPQSTTLTDYMTKDQKVYVLIYTTYPASATNQSNLYTDYIKLDLTLADYVDYVPSNIVKVRPETKEMKLFFPNTSRRYLGHQSSCGENQVALHYRYVPYQGQGSIAKSKIVAVGTPIITTLGTGAYPSDTQSVGINAMSTRLPSPVQDYNLIADKFISEGMSTTIDGLLLKQSAIINGFYRLTPKAGMWFDSNSTVSETVVRGVTGRPTFSTDVIAASGGQSMYKFSLPTTLPSEGLISLPILVLDSSELKLIVVSFRKNQNSTLWYYASSGIYDHFKLPGRPLVKNL